MMVAQPDFWVFSKDAVVLNTGCQIEFHFGESGRLNATLGVVGDSSFFRLLASSPPLLFRIDRAGEEDRDVCRDASSTNESTRL